MNLFHHTVAVLAIAVPSTAQSAVVRPAAWAGIDSPGGNAFPFGSRAVPFRYLNVHDDMAGAPRRIVAFGLRRSGATSTSTVPPTAVVVDGFFSTATTTGATVDATFDNNHGPDKVQVLTGRTINFPAAPTGLLPYPFLYRLPLDAPFPFGGSGPLCWEVRVTSRPATSGILFHDYVSGTAANPRNVVSRFGDGCNATNRATPFALTGASANDWPNGSGSLNATASNGPPNAAAALLLGFVAFPAGIRIPGTSGFPSGTCYLLADAPLSVAGTLSSTGGLTFRIPVPLQPAWNGGHVYAQAVAPDSAANAFGWVTSNGIDHQVVAPFGVQPGGRIYRSGSLDATGIVGRGQTLVVQFTSG